MNEIKSEEIIKCIKIFHEQVSLYIAQLKNIIEQETIHYKNLEELSKALERIYETTIRTLAETIDAKSNYMIGHSNKVQRYATIIGKRLYLTTEEQKALEIAALLHDIGRIAISNNIWDKPGKLSSEEYELVKKHPSYSADVVQSISFLNRVTKIIKAHHERYDGKGYPDGLKGEDIPLEARILAIADAYDAMTSMRSYKDKKEAEEAINEITKLANEQFDPIVVQAFVSEYRKGNII